MTDLRLKKMRLVNFKGIRQLEVDFGGSVTSVSGANGTGKTTLFDAFTWTLFGKDSKDRKQFDIKTLDSQGRAIPRLPHEVMLIIEANGIEITLTRRFTEKWVKRRGSATEEFTGHTEERLYNEVPCSAKEWSEKISSLCNESVFKFITSPDCFVSQKPEVQRAMLLRMAGGFSDNDVIAASGQRQDFITLLGSLCGKTMEEYKREIAAKKRIIKAELDTLPGRIDERQRDIAALGEIDRAAAESGIAQAKAELQKIEERMTDAQKRVDAEIQARKKDMEALGELYGQAMKMEQDAFASLGEDAIKLRLRAQHLKSEMQLIDSRSNELREKMAKHQAQTDSLAAQRQTLIEEWKGIKAMRLQFGADAFTCPTCRQQLPAQDIEKKRAEMVQNHNEHVATLLAYNKEKGAQCSSAIIEARKAEHEAMGKQLAQLLERYSQARTQLESMPAAEMPTQEQVSEYLKGNARYQEMTEQAEALKSKQAQPQAEASDETAELAASRKALLEKIDGFKSQLEKASTAERNAERIKELTQQIREQSEELARLEGIEFTMAEFSKVRNEAINAKVGSLFQIVRFKMYETQINGGEVETCEAMVGGIPYSSLNNAMQINAGLDIINAICRHEGIAAPIFIDNCESVNQPLQTIGQQIRLYVTNDESLKIQ